MQKPGLPSQSLVWGRRREGYGEMTNTLKIKYSTLFWIIFMGVFLFWLFLSDDVPSENNINPTNQNQSEDEEVEPLSYETEIIKTGDNSEYPYWKSLPIHYYFSNESSCNKEQKERLLYGFRIITRETDDAISFYEERSDKSIEIDCYPELIDEEGFAVAGEGASYFEDSKEIVFGTIDLYYVDCSEYECQGGYPDTEIHEILHTLGFDHVTDRRSIMNARGDGVNRELDLEVINCLKRIYFKDKTYICERVKFME